jgi:DNA-directed RNA polymerase subunit beta
LATCCSSEAKAAELRKFLEEVYNSRGRKEDLSQLSDDDLLAMAQNLTNGVPFATPVFDGASEEEIKDMLKLAYPTTSPSARA